MAIKNIIFDFGNVLFDLDLGRTGREMQQILGSDYAQIRQKLERDKVFELYEVGGLSTPEFIDALRFAAHPPLSEVQVTDAWNSIFIGMPAARFDMLLQLRERYKVFLLSNINDLHERWIEAYMEREHGIFDFERRYFDGVYYSHLLRLRKPNRDIYEYVLADAELLPDETIFFDDLEVNITGARQVGIQAILHPAGAEITEVVRRLTSNV
jgi:putative hydrolase of the HAD superfamily